MGMGGMQQQVGITYPAPRSQQQNVGGAYGAGAASQMQQVCAEKGQWLPL